MKWLPVVGYEGQYEVSDTGKVRGLRRIDAGGRNWPGKMLRPKTDKDGYHRFTLAKNKLAFGHYAHRLVLAAFCGMPEDGQITRHLDGSKTNNSPSNLQWGTPKENTDDAQTHGTIPRKGINNGLSKINAVTAERVRDLLKSGATQRQVARWFEICEASVSNIHRGDGRFSINNQIGAS